MKPIRVDERRIESFDGTELVTQSVGGGLPVMLVNGLAGSCRAWKHQIAYLSDRYRLICWDYRGLYDSSRPVNPDALRVEDHALDALAIMDALSVERAAFVGWSVGTQVSLEVFRGAPERVASMVMINGVAGHPWETSLGLRAAARVLPTMVRAALAVPRLSDVLTRRVARWPEILPWALRLGLVGSTIDTDLFQELAHGVAHLDIKQLLRVAELLGEHDAQDVLGDVDVPVLVIAADRDPFTTRRACEGIVRAVPGAELMVVPGGSHYLAMEFPELVNLRIEKFFRERGYAARPAHVA